MANGDQLDHDSYLLQDSAVATSNGVWVDNRKCKTVGIRVSGITTGTVQIHGSNDKLKPSDAADGTKIGSDITADGWASIAHPVRWIKAKVSAYTSGTFIVNSHGLR